MVWTILPALTVLAAACPALPQPAASRPATPATAAEDSALARADRFLRRGATDSALVLVNPVIARAIAAGDARNELRGRLNQAGALALCGRLRDAEQTARRADELARVLDAPAAGRMARRWLGYALLGQGRAAEATETYTALRDDAQAAGDNREEAYARMGLAYQALGRGEATLARTEYERSAALFAAAGENAIGLDALVGLARALGAEGRYQEMRRLYERILREGESQGQARIVGYALNNLGSYEYQAGDPGRAVEYWDRALETKRKGADPVAMITPTVNLALAHMSLGAFDEARVALQEMLELCRVGGYREQEAQVLQQLATFEKAHGRHAESRAMWREVMALGAAAGQFGPEAAIEIAASLAVYGQPQAALQFADSLTAAFPADADGQLQARLDLARAAALAALGRHRDALAPAARARAAFRAGGFRSDELGALVLLGATERELARGEPARADSALARLNEARILWENVRAVPRDPQWRERRGALGANIHMNLAAVLLDYPADRRPAERAQRAFDALQGYKARTLLERRLGPDAFAAGAAAVDPPVTMARLQGEVLRPGELLLDYYLGPDGSLVFAVTDTSCRVARLSSAQALRGPVGLFLELVATPAVPAGGPSLDHGPAARRLGHELLGSCGPELAGARRVLIAADGLLNRLPFELLPPDDGAAEALGSTCEVTRVPSATVLARVRQDGAAGATAVSAPRGVCVLAGGDGDATGRLPGAGHESRQLSRRYRDVRALESGADPVGGLWLQAAAGAAVLHIPAHSEAFDQRPWNSRIRVGTGDDGRPWWLLSGAIAATPLGVPLAVLSGCSSAGGQALSGEGMLGLTGAFLAAGSQAVVASLWDVDDGATSLLMDRFYRELADGRTVAGALAAARQALAGDPATAAPCYWAGFVVVGDGALTVPLRPRTAKAPLAAWGGGAAFLVGAGALLARRRKRLSSPVCDSPAPPGSSMMDRDA
jgi:tetratricopeptide (TPR) repeat protein